MPKLPEDPKANQSPKSAKTPRQTPPVDDSYDWLDGERGDLPVTLERSAEIVPIRPGLTQDTSWQLGLREYRGKNGQAVGITRDAGNAALILANDPAWSGLRYDSFRGQEVYADLPPLDRFPMPSTPEGLELYVGHWLATKWQQTFSVEAVRGAISAACRQRPFHPVREYLEALTWDGESRLSGWLSAYLGATDSPTHQAIARMWMVSAVARAYQPGSKADHMLVLEGDQGAGKTTALEALCSPAWFQPELGDLRNKDSQLTLRGKWIVCMDELHALRSADVTELAKNYLTRTIDKYRPPYGRHEVEQPRSCVFAGTTNADAYLTDPTGNRRFWPVRVGKEKPVDIEAIKRDRDQLWAEAKEAFLGKEQWWPSKELSKALSALTFERTQADVWEDLIADELRGRDWITVTACLEKCGLKPGDFGRAEQMRVSKLLVGLGWERYRHVDAGRQEWRYRPKLFSQAGRET